VDPPLRPDLEEYFKRQHNIQVSMNFVHYTDMDTGNAQHAEREATSGGQTSGENPRPRVRPLAPRVNPPADLDFPLPFVERGEATSGGQTTSLDSNNLSGQVESYAPLQIASAQVGPAALDFQNDYSSAAPYPEAPLDQFNQTSDAYLRTGGWGYPEGVRNYPETNPTSGHSLSERADMIGQTTD
jgi:hypothetical protein